MDAHHLAPGSGDRPTAVRRGAACLLVALCVGGCRDAPTDPLATLLTEETAPALEVEIALPSLGDLAARTGTEARLVRPLRVWSASRGSPEAAQSVHEGDLAVAEAAPVLADALGPGGVISVLAPLHQALRSLGDLTDVPARMEPELEEIRRVGAASRTALADGQDADALRDGLIAADRLRALGPEAVARALVARGEATLQRSGDGGAAAADVDFRRGRELLQRARRALEAGDYARAVQRAFYACQLLEGSDRN